MTSKPDDDDDDPAGAGSWWCWPGRRRRRRAAARAAPGRGPGGDHRGRPVAAGGVAAGAARGGPHRAVEALAGDITPICKGFVGLRASLLMCCFWDYCGAPRGGAARCPRPGPGPRAGPGPGGQTIRRKLAELAGHGRGAARQGGLARHHGGAGPDAVGFLYVDGRVRVYTGTRESPRRTSRGCGSPGRRPRRPGSPTPRGPGAGGRRRTVGVPGR